MSNLFANLAAAGLNISYDFLGEPAGYDINQRLIEYDSQMSHGRAAIVGILNTLLVSFLACVTATVLGVVAGVLRPVQQLADFEADVGLRGSIPERSGSHLDPDRFHYFHCGYARPSRLQG